MTRLLAQIRNPVLPPTLGGNASANAGQAVGNLIAALIGVILTFSFVFALFYLLLGGFEWLTSGGDKTHLEAARNKITHALMGLTIVAATWAIMVIVGQFFGLGFTGQMFNLPLPTLGP